MAKKKTVKKKLTGRSAAKKSATKTAAEKAVAKKKATSKSGGPKKEAATKPRSAKKAAAKKTGRKQASAKKTVARKSAAKQSSAAAKLGRARITGDAKLDEFFKRDYEARQVFEFLRVHTLKELEEFAPEEIIERLTGPMVRTIDRIRKALALNNRSLKDDERYAVEFLSSIGGSPRTRKAAPSRE